MFQTELIHSLQALGSEGVTQFMLLVSSLGYAYTLVPILVVIAFGIDFRRGLLLIQIVLWNTVVTEFLKFTFALPRPDAVDSSLLQPGDDRPEIGPFVRSGAPGFWAPLPAEVVSYYREQGSFSYGFPSGHCSVTTALWGSMALVFKERRLWVLALSLTTLMALSRMYLARHFLAGVLGGIGVGLLVTVVAWKIALGPVAGGGSAPDRLRRAGSTDLARFLLYLGPPVLMMFVPGVGLVTVMRLVGVYLGLWLLTGTGLPEGGGESSKRFLRVVLAITIYAVVNRSFDWLFEATLGRGDLLEALVEGLSTFALTWGTSVASYRLGLYRRGRPGVGLLGGDVSGA